MKKGNQEQKSGQRIVPKFDTQRKKAWRNLMVLGFNEALRREIISLTPGDMWWTKVKRTDETSRGVLFDFKIEERLPARGYLYDGGWDEIGLRVALHPKNEEHLLMAHDPGLYAGDAIACGWLERSEGAWLQFNGKVRLCCRQQFLSQLAEMNVLPRGFSDQGKYFF